MFHRISNFLYCNPFWNARTTNKSEQADFADFDGKIGSPLERLEKRRPDA